MSRSLSWLPAGAEPVESSRCEGEDFELVFASRYGMESLFVRGGGALVRDLAGVAADGVKVCPPTHFNRLVLNAYLPFTAPAAFGRTAATLGLGDRLGLCAGAHIRAVQNSRLKPVLAQQSLRELSFMRRSYDDMIDAAAYGALRAGYRGGYAADGDHLKTAEQIKRALRDDCTMITLDCSDVLEDLPPGAPVHERYMALPEETRARLEAEYPHDADAARLGLRFGRETLERLAVQYGESVALAAEIYRHTLLPHRRTVDYELSLDETASVTTHEAHYFVAKELTRLSVAYTSVAPRFVGEFHKGVEYVGSLPGLFSDMEAHARIAAHFGHKLSVHSASDKFSVYAALARSTNGLFHVKTSGTSWLCAVRTLAMYEPALYRRMHARALEAFPEAKKAYTVHADPMRVAPLSDTPDALLPLYLEKDDSRQLMHITYGYLFSDPALAADIGAALVRHKAELEEQVASHISAHIRALGGYEGEGE